jgi:hypothetical protein
MTNLPPKTLLVVKIALEDAKNSISCDGSRARQQAYAATMPDNISTYMTAANSYKKTMEKLDEALALIAKAEESNLTKGE